MAKRFAIRPDPPGYAVYDTSTGLLAVIGATPQHGLTLDEAEWTAGTLNNAHGAHSIAEATWDGLLAEWRSRYEAIAAFALFDEGAFQSANLAELDRLCDLERRAREQVEAFLTSLRRDQPDVGPPAA